MRERGGERQGPRTLFFKGKQNEKRKKGEREGREVVRVRKGEEVRAKKQMSDGVREREKEKERGIERQRDGAWCVLRCA